MWKNIKKVFKWIADHTGISWIARKISSGWKSCWSDSQENDFVIVDMPKKPESVILNAIYEENGKLVLTLSIDTAQKVFGSTHLESMKEYCAEIKSGKGEFQITGSKFHGIDHQSCSFLFSINKVVNQDIAFDNIEKMKEMLGLNDATREVKVNDIYEISDTFIPKVVQTSTPNSKTTSSEVQQHTVGDDLSVNA